METNHETIPYKGQRSIASIPIVNYKGKLLINYIVSPRHNVRHYHTKEHGLDEEHLGEWDERECNQSARKILLHTVVISFRVAQALKCMRTSPQIIMGIRDISTAQCFSKYSTSKKTEFKLSYFPSINHYQNQICGLKMQYGPRESYI